MLLDAQEQEEEDYAEEEEELKSKNSDKNRIQPIQWDGTYLFTNDTAGRTKFNRATADGLDQMARRMEVLTTGGEMR
ncbi:hypothetical protein TWF696_008533 [Orbilia brochopaga]|uniref:Uncharacterized protein n=1 Tax=Orbilia brochopaga TaxID=3140254 RepID=A0AAV9UH51_9PEZI